MPDVSDAGRRGHDGKKSSCRAPKGGSLVWFDSIAGKDGLASTAGPSVLGPGQPFPAGRAVAVVLGYWDAGDGGGGLFYWDAPSNTKPDGGTVFAIACHPLGRWIRLTEGPMSVKWFGARLDGAHDDREAVQAALNSGAGVVLIPPGICAIYDAPLSIPSTSVLTETGAFSLGCNNHGSTGNPPYSLRFLQGVSWLSAVGFGSPRDVGYGLPYSAY